MVSLLALMFGTQVDDWAITRNKYCEDINKFLMLLAVFITETESDHIDRGALDKNLKKLEEEVVWNLKREMTVEERISFLNSLKDMAMSEPSTQARDKALKDLLCFNFITSK